MIKVKTYTVSITTRFDRTLSAAEATDLRMAGVQVRAQAPVLRHATDQVNPERLYTMTVESDGLSIRDSISTAVSYVERLIGVTLGTEGLDWLVSDVTAHLLSE